MFESLSVVVVHGESDSIAKIKRVSKGFGLGFHFWEFQQKNMMDYCEEMVFQTQNDNFKVDFQWFKVVSKGSEQDSKYFDYEF